MTPEFKAGFHGEPSLQEKNRAFTLIELLVVIAIIAILAAILLPVLSQAQVRAQGISCLSNMKQLQTASILYAGDNNDQIPNNSPWQTGGDTSVGHPNWVDGYFGNKASGPGTPAGNETNIFYLGVLGDTMPGLRGSPLVLLGSIGGYVRNPGVYHCPADHYLDPNYHVLRDRSCSANMQVGTLMSVAIQNAPPPWFGCDWINYQVFQKYSDFKANMSTADCFEFVDENPATLNDGWIEYVLNGSGVIDRPAVNHGNSSSFSFCDGHAELHPWHDTFLNINNTALGSDTYWLAQHGSVAIVANPPAQ
jgi:prepilin-type N-terminal cleavage/methylation domain-containing protein/prepilin-type processing-associated H-X9-DG protein